MSNVITTENPNYFEEAEKYWINKISGNLEDLELFSDFQAANKYEKMTYEVSLEDQITDQLLRISKDNDLSCYIILLVVFKILLHKYTGKEEIITPSPLFNASNNKYNSYVIFRDYINPDLSFKEFLMKVRQTVVDGYKHEFYPIVNILEIMNMEKSFLFRYALVLENIHGKEFARDVLKNQENDIFFSFRKTAHRLEGEITFNSKKYRLETLHALFESYSRILAQVLNKTDIKLKDIDLVSGEEKSEILFKFNNSKKKYPLEKTIPQLFQEQVSRTPDNKAVRSTLDVRNVYDKEKYRKVDIYLSYKELNDRVNQLAYELRSKGVKADSIIGMMVEHPLELVVAIIGILKAGGAYLPLDLSHPGKFMASIIENSGMQMLVTEGALEERIPELHSAIPVVYVDDDQDTVDMTTNFESVNTPSDLAYVIYTSGTTGMPKGTLVEHRGVVNYTCWRIENYNFSEKDITLQPLSYSFDGFTSNFYSSLLSGGVLFMIPDSKRMDFHYMKEVIRDYQVTNTSLVPGIYQAILEVSEKSDLKSLRFVVLAGDKSGAGLIGQSKEMAPHVKLINEYGPTEATVTAAANLEFNREDASVIGKPISNVSIYILAAFLKPVPVYIAGEMYISGVGVVREYLDNPKLTGEKFFQDPFIEGQRMYRTGDFARWLSGGDIEFLGRLDNQVKTRGYRVELEQIENVLLNHEEIIDAVVLAKDTGDDNSGDGNNSGNNSDKYLCAFVVPQREIDSGELKEYLVSQLPDYMVPVHIVCLDKIPITGNGKKDVKALAQLDTYQQPREQIAPRNEFEEKLTEIWSEVLRIPKDKIYINSNFFELGGHSLNATTVIYKIHKILDVKISVADMFDFPTIMLLSDHIHGAEKEEYISIEPVEKKEYYPLSSAQKRLYILNQMDKLNTGYNTPLVAALEGTVDKNKMQDTFRKLICRHENLRTSYELLGDTLVQKIKDDVPFNLDFQEKDKSEIEETFNRFVRPFDLAHSPLLRAALVDIGTSGHILMVDMHHIISDGISLNLLTRDFVALYTDDILPGLRLNYKDYSEWQNRNKTSEVSTRQEAFWLKEFPGEVPILDMPADFERPPVKSFAGSIVDFQLNHADTGRLNQLAETEGVTLYMVLLAIFNVFLAKLGNSEDVVIGSPVAGRVHADLEKIIGLFINTVPIRNFPEGEKTFTVFLSEIKEKTLTVYENQDYQFEDILGKVAVKRDASRNPLFDVMFAFQELDSPPENLNAIGLEMTGDQSPVSLKEYTFETRTSKFDLTLLGSQSPLEWGKEGPVSFSFEFCTKLFKEETIKRFITYFKNIVSAVISNPGQKIADLEMVSLEEKQRLLHEMNQTDKEFPQDKTILDLFEPWVNQTPDAAAVKSGEKQFTYKQLKQKSDGLARVLRDKGTGPNQVIGIMAERSPETVIGILAILKAGGAFMPVDSDYPEKRKQFLLKNSKANILLLDKPWHESDQENDRFHGFDLTDVLVIGADDLYPPVEVDIKIVNKPGDLAYVIYTSGSTGKPKGVMVEHRGLVNYICRASRQYVGNDKVNFPLYTSISFDLTLTSLFTPLVTGNAIVIYNEEDKRTLMEKIIDDNQVGVVKLTPSHLKLIREKQVSRSAVRRFIVGGENLDTDLAMDIRTNFSGDIEIYNEYGPTEAVIGCMIYKFDPDRATGKSVPIGLPIDNTRIYILDKSKNPVPIGVTGELYISGIGLARGYLGNDELTAEKFIENPFEKEEKERRMYRTGDLARWLPQGGAEFMGRVDNQVKIRGFRIEIGEIEHQLLKHKEIKDAVVVIRGGESRERYLCAYFVSAIELDVVELRDYLAQTLPSYMIPSYFVQMETLPLDVNGKVDKTRLLRQEITREQFTLPETDMEKIVAEVWKDVLELDQVSVHDTFFDIGGNSLDMIKVMSKLKTILGREITLMKMVEYSTIRSFCRYLLQGDQGESVSEEKEEDIINKMEANMKESLRLFEKV